jgi:pimeloyl-ACP methyl ester carboxylesterase
MSEFVTSADGTRIAYDRDGDGPTVILVGGAFQFRAFDPTTAEMGRQLAGRGFRVVNHDRRGRGESQATPPFTLARELEDLAALIDANGGEAMLYGSSSGGSISLAAAAAGLPVTRLALWEVPLDEELGSGGASNLAGLRERLATGDNERAVEFFMKDMPPAWLEAARQGPGWPTQVALAPSLEPDVESLAWTQSAPRAELWARITQPTLVLLGEQTMPFMQAAADSMLGALPHARLARFGGADHRWEPAMLVPLLAEFFGGDRPPA